MLNKAAKLALVATSLAPICLTLLFVEFSKSWDWQQGWGYLLTALLMSVTCYGLIRLLARKLESLPVKIKSKSCSRFANAAPCSSTNPMTLGYIHS